MLCFHQLIKLSKVLCIGISQIITVVFQRHTMRLYLSWDTLSTPLKLTTFVVMHAKVSVIKSHASWYKMITGSVRKKLIPKRWHSKMFLLPLNHHTMSVTTYSCVRSSIQQFVIEILSSDVQQISHSTTSKIETCFLYKVTSTKC